ncbi:Rrf2 family transcriptional regulator [Solihabitans fulvus]|uniref:Rrf2 family transcriptional regulator n=1 Tax=Solihabitans fulvus TaxID=1892852 RepID=A0A5B2XIT1_9PSEU|nr:Rrf2 family transcriptional regulator [Solihabitans fulvus]KAA2262710.1 Rrf2 family transcriptional regulator [Solihabitans fulvus]
MRISAKVDYAVRAMAELAAARPGDLVRAEDVAAAQDIPVAFLLTILNDLKSAHLVRGHRGRGGGYSLARPSAEITVADVARAIEGPLARIRDVGLRDLSYTGPATALLDVWMAVRTSLRSVLENVTLADLVDGHLPPAITAMATEYRTKEHHRGRTTPLAGQDD